jgi:hypothetical protein
VVAAEAHRVIASWRGLGVAAAIAVALAIAVAVDLGRAPDATDRALVPGFDPDRVTELVWERSGQPAIRVARGAGGWDLRAPGPAQGADIPVDPGAIADVLAALRGARWHRRGDPGPVHATLTVVSGQARHAIGIGEPVAGTEQIWLVDDGRGALVDRWVARALDRDLLALRIKAPLAGIHQAGQIAIAASPAGDVLRIAGSPRQLTAPVQLVIAAELVGELERALADVVIVRLPDTTGAAHGLAITAGDDPPGGDARAVRVVRVVLGGSCPGAPELVALSGTTGDGCVEPAVAAAVDRAIARLRQAPEAIVERRPVPFEAARVVLADGAALDTAALRIGDAAADQARVAELLAALAAPAEVARLPSTPAVHHVVVGGRAGAAVTLDLFAEQTLARHGEPIALRPAPGAFRLLVRPSRELRDVTLWLEEPTTITAVRIDGTSYQRGAAIGDWTRRPADATGAGPAEVKPADKTTLEALVAILAAPRSLGFVDDPVVITHHVTLAITPPVGLPAERTLALGAPRPAGCPARLAHDTILLPAVVCAQLAALAR